MNLRDFNIISVILRMLLAFVCGGLIGVERETKRKPAGLRTHILICLGACMTTLTGQYLVLVAHLYTDMARLGAQVICGIGFIGAGVIMFTRQRRVKGLTTAAGLWVDGIVGLCCGSGFYEGAITASALVLFAEHLLIRVEDRQLKTASTFVLRLSAERVKALNSVMEYLNDLDVHIVALDVRKEKDTSACSADITLQLHRKVLPEDLKADVAKMNGILSAEEL